ncbi:hypothetical protein WJX77_012698 [Trebouxia sp. C0004]
MHLSLPLYVLLRANKDHLPEPSATVYVKDSIQALIAAHGQLNFLLEHGKNCTSCLLVLPSIRVWMTKRLLSSFGVPTEKAVEVYGDIVAPGDTLLAAYTAAIDVAEETLTKSNKTEDEVKKLTKALKRSESLAILRDHIKDFRIDIAYNMQFCSWAALEDKLHHERKKRSLKEFHQGNDLGAEDVMQLLNNKSLPDDLVHTKASLEQMLQYVAE